MSEMQAAGRKERSAMDNLLIMKIQIENQRAQKLTYMLFANASINYGLKTVYQKYITEAMIPTNKNFYMK